MSEVEITFWYKCSSEDQESVNSNLCIRNPSTSRTPENLEKVWAANYKNLMERQLEDDMGIKKTTVSKILKEDLGMKLVTAKFFMRIFYKCRRNFMLPLPMTCFKVLKMTHIFSKRS